MSVTAFSAPCRYGSAFRIGEPRCMCSPTTARPGCPTTPFATSRTVSMSRPNLTPLTEVSVLACVLGGRSGLTRRATCAFTPSRLRDCAEGVQLLLALDVEQEDAVLEGELDLGVGLADAGEDDLRPRSAGLERAVELAAGGDVEPGPVLGHEPADAEVAVGLDAVADDRVRRRRTRSASRFRWWSSVACCRRTAACRTVSASSGTGTSSQNSVRSR